MSEEVELTGDWTFCQRALVDVSRSFAIIIPQCPPPVDRALCTAYLLCRVADTIEDEPALKDDQRERLFDLLLGLVDQPDNRRCLQRFQSCWPGIRFSQPGYELLVRGVNHVLAVYRRLLPEAAGPIRRCVHDMVNGMRAVQPVEQRDGVAFFCRDLSDLDRYCHIVAGTVGVMSTAIFEWHLARHGFTATDKWREQGRRLGLGLQMTNIVKDCRVDAARRVSFIPSCYVETTGGAYILARGRQAEVFEHAVSHLDEGLGYTLAVPRTAGGIRQFLLGSLLPAIATLEVAAGGADFHPKISRAGMAEILAMTSSQQTTDPAIKSWYADRRKRTLEQVSGD